MKILMTGATGLIGSRIARQLVEEGHQLVLLTRNEAAARKKLQISFEAYFWDSLSGPPPASAFTGVEGVIHLAGEPIAESRWTVPQKKKIRRSRVLGTRHLVKAMASLKNKPRVFISASAIGYYGDRGDEELTEESAPGRGFLAEVCQAWEREAKAPEISDIRTVIVRVGIALSRKGGALAKLVPIFKLGLGGSIGGGKQWMSWIHLDDLSSVFIYCLKNQSVEGVLNAVAPGAVRNRDFARALGKALRRPAVFVTPEIILKVVLGELSSAILSSQKTRPAKLTALGFRFAFPELQSALRNLFGKRKRP